MELISESFVKPIHEVEALKQRIYLTPLEICMLGINPIQKGVLYALPQPTSSTLLNVLDKLKSSLSIALTHFYPLSGRFATETFADEHACVVFIDCSKGPGAKLTHVKAMDITVSDLVLPIHDPVIVSKFFNLGENYVNFDCHTRPLLSIQVTELVDGFFIGFTMSHAVVDGTSFIQFLSMLSEIICCSDSTNNMLSLVYRGVANVVSESCWLRNLLLELHAPPSKATLVYCDNVSAIYLSGNPVQHQRTKHIEMDIHFVREKVTRGQVRVLHIPSKQQIADIFTKGLPRVLFDDFRSSLNVHEPPVSTAGCNRYYANNFNYVNNHNISFS